MPARIIAAIVVLLLLPCAHAGSISYAYDALNRLTPVNYGNGAVINYTYDAAGNRLTQVVRAPSTVTITTQGVPAGYGSCLGRWPQGDGHERDGGGHAEPGL